MPLLDSHAHLSDIEDPEAAIVRARAAGVSGVVAVGASLGTSLRTLEIAGRHRGYVHPAVGIHPTEFFKEDVEEALRFVEEQAPRCVAVGEIGLDYWAKPVRKDRALRERQMEVYVRQLRLARRLSLPAVIHSRGAWRDCLTLAAEHGPGEAVFHWYSGPLDVLGEVLDRGFYVSCTPALGGSPELRAAMERAPLERILVETDSPVWIRGEERPSEPADVALTAGHLAALKGLSVDDIAEATARNAERLFRL